MQHPEAFHGHGVRTKFFEGWYVKLVSADLTQRWAVIPGVFLGLDGTTNEAFVQVLDGSSGRSWYHRYDVSEFAASDLEFSAQVGPNRFSRHGVSLDLPQVKGDLHFTSPLEGWPVTLREPGIMGWYGLVPFMECFHGIVSFGHGLGGVLEVEGTMVSFDRGRGYIEKDWGKAFPEGYVWLHSNHIEQDPDASFIGSVAIIPWLGGAFRGFIVGLRHHGVLHRFTTYNKTLEKGLTITDSHVEWTLQGPSGSLEIVAERSGGGALHAPIREAMHQRVEETLKATFHLRHISPDGTTLLDSSAQVGAMEVYGDIEKLVGMA